MAPPSRGRNGRPRRPKITTKKTARERSAPSRRELRPSSQAGRVLRSRGRDTGLPGSVETGNASHRRRRLHCPTSGRRPRAPAQPVPPKPQSRQRRPYAGNRCSSMARCEPPKQSGASSLRAATSARSPRFQPRAAAAGWPRQPSAPNLHGWQPDLLRRRCQPVPATTHWRPLRPAPPRPARPTRPTRRRRPKIPPRPSHPPSPAQERSPSQPAPRERSPSEPTPRERLPSQPAPQQRSPSQPAPRERLPSEPAPWERPRSEPAPSPPPRL